MEKEIIEQIIKNEESRKNPETEEGVQATRVHKEEK